MSVIKHVKSRGVIIHQIYKVCKNGDLIRMWAQSLLQYT